MTRFNDSLADTLEYVAEHGTRYTWSDFKVVLDNPNQASYAWDTTANTYKWTGTPQFSYRLDIDKNVENIVIINDGTLTDTFIMDDGVHGAVDYNANIISNNSVQLMIYTKRNSGNILYYSYIGSHNFITINNVDYKNETVLGFNYTDYPSSFGYPLYDVTITDLQSTDFCITSIGSFYFNINLENGPDNNKQLLYGALFIQVRNIFNNLQVTGKSYRMGEL